MFCVLFRIVCLGFSCFRFSLSCFSFVFLFACVFSLVQLVFLCLFSVLSLFSLNLFLFFKIFL